MAPPIVTENLVDGTSTSYSFCFGNTDFLKFKTVISMKKSPLGAKKNHMRKIEIWRISPKLQIAHNLIVFDEICQPKSLHLENPYFKVAKMFFLQNIVIFNCHLVIFFHLHIHKKSKLTTYRSPQQEYVKHVSSMYSLMQYVQCTSLKKNIYIYLGAARFPGPPKLHDLQNWFKQLVTLHLYSTTCYMRDWTAFFH